MIDTITLRLNELQFRVYNTSKFSPDCHNFFVPPYTRMGGRGYIDAYQNPTKKELLNGNYKPQLTLRKRWMNGRPQILLYIQFSAPKLLFGNNFDELVESDIDIILNKLKSKLLGMGIFVEISDLEKALVSKIHYSKNIILPEYVIPSMIVGEVRKVDFDARYDIAEKDYRNSGSSLRFHLNDFEYILYDKKKDLAKAMNSEKKAIEKDNCIQLNIFDEIKAKKHFEVLRIEVRLNSISRIKKELGIPKIEQTIRYLFNSTLCMKSLNKYWLMIMDNYKILNCQIEDKERFLAEFMINNPNAKLTSALSVYAFIEFANSMGIKKLRKMIEHGYSNKTWYNFKSTLNKYIINKNSPLIFDSISNSLRSYSPLKLKDYKDLL